MSKQQNTLMGWIDDRLPVTQTYEKHMSKYYAPKNFNFWYFFGVLSMMMLANQILTGVWLTMNFVPSAEGAFASVEFIMRDVQWGWLIRYLHSTGATFVFQFLNINAIWVVRTHFVQRQQVNNNQTNNH